MPERGRDITELLVAWSAGDREALDRLVDVAYPELHALARRAMRGERRDHTLQPTALVNELYLKLVDQDRADWRNRAQFFAVAARLIRRILVDHARRRARAKRGGGATRVTAGIEDVAPVPARPEVDVLALEGALRGLRSLDPRQEQVVELRFFGGLTIREAASVLAVSPATVKRDWETAKAWLQREMGGGVSA